VAGELTAVLRGANDNLSDADRLLLVPLPGPATTSTARLRRSRGLRAATEFLASAFLGISARRPTAAACQQGPGALHRSPRPLGRHPDRV